MFKYIFILLVVTLTVGSCSDNKPSTKVDWGESTEHYLNGQQVSIKLPNKFKPSSRFRITSEIPAIRKNKQLANIVQDALEYFEETDKNIDLFIDTTSQYHYVTLLDAGEKITIDKASTASLAKRIQEDYDEMNFRKRGLEVTQLQSNIKKNNQQQMAKFKFEIKNKRNNTKTYATSFFVNNSTRSLIIHEFSDKEEDIEFFTWSLNENY